MKHCPDCRRDGEGPKPLSAFGVDSQTPDGHSTYCRDHRRTRGRERYHREGDVYHAKRTAWQKQNPERMREYDVRKRVKEYGLSEAEYKALYFKQHGKCAICTRSIVSHFTAARSRAKGDTSQSRDTTRVDHCHETGRVRGLLCLNCNASLGGFRDDEKHLLAAVRYLRESATAQRTDRAQHDTLQGAIEPRERDLDSSRVRGSRKSQLYQSFF